MAVVVIFVLIFVVMERNQVLFYPPFFSHDIHETSQVASISGLDAVLHNRLECLEYVKRLCVISLLSVQ